MVFNEHCKRKSASSCFNYQVTLLFLDFDSNLKIYILVAMQLNFSANANLQAVVIAVSE